MSERPPVERPVTRYWRDSKIVRGCVSEMPALAKTPAQELAPPPEFELLQDLIELGATFPDSNAALIAIELAFDRAGDWRAAEAMALIFSRLPISREGTKLRQALLGTRGEGVTAAGKNGVCKQSWFTAITRLRERLCKPHD